MIILMKKEKDGYIHKYCFTVTNGGMAVEKTPHIEHIVMNERGTYNRSLSWRETTKEDGNNFYKELLKKGYVRQKFNF